MSDNKRKNGYGSVYRLQGQRSKPYIAIITERCTYDESKNKYYQKRLPIGYFGSKDEAIIALFLYHNANHDAPTVEKTDNITFKKVYEDWKHTHFQSLSASMIRTWESAYKYFRPVYETPFRQLQAIDLENCISETNLHSSTRIRMKSLCNQLYKYAMKCGLVNLNQAKLLDQVRPDPPVYPHKAFSEEELRLLWAKKELPYVDLILLACYTGLRPSELIGLTKDQLNLASAELCCGIKTNAGKKRTVPILTDILPIFEKHLSEAIRYHQNHIFLKEDHQPLDYKYYWYQFQKIMKLMKMEHRPHDTRHTFITLAKESGMNEYILKRIVGHAINDLTEKVYTHRSPKLLHSEMQKLHIWKA